MTEKWYKVLTNDLKSGHGGTFDWSRYVGCPEKRAPVIEDVAICRRGYHATTDPMQWAIVGMRVFEAVVDGPPADTSKDKGVWPTMGLGYERLELVPTWWHGIEAFIAELQTFPWLQPQGEPNSEWLVFGSRDDASDAAAEVLWSMHWGAVWDSAHEVAWEAASEAGLVGALDIAGDVVWEETRSMVRGHKVSDIQYAGGLVACDAARDAALWARMLICSGLPLAQRHIEHARARMEVWRRGYGLLCDVDGVLYVYERP